MKISRNSFASSIRGALACIRCAHVYVQCICLNRDSAKRMEKERKDLFSKFKNINVSDLFLTNKLLIYRVTILKFNFRIYTHAFSPRNETFNHFVLHRMAM